MAGYSDEAIKVFGEKFSEFILAHLEENPDEVKTASYYIEKFKTKYPEVLSCNGKLKFRKAVEISCPHLIWEGEYIKCGTIPDFTDLDTQRNDYDVAAVSHNLDRTSKDANLTLLGERFTAFVSEYETEHNREDMIADTVYDVFKVSEADLLKKCRRFNFKKFVDSYCGALCIDGKLIGTNLSQSKPAMHVFSTPVTSSFSSVIGSVPNSTTVEAHNESALPRRERTRKPPKKKLQAVVEVEMETNMNGTQFPTDVSPPPVESRSVPAPVQHEKSSHSDQRDKKRIATSELLSQLFEEVPIYALEASDWSALLDVLPVSLRVVIDQMEDSARTSIVQIHFEMSHVIELCHLSADGSLTRSVAVDDSGNALEVNDEMLQAMAGAVEPFSSSSCAWVAGTLHRVARRLTPSNALTALVLHIAHADSSLHRLLRTELETGQSVLLVGRAGSGKTSLLRSVAAELGGTRRVEVVDTFGELCGIGETVHPSVGQARRVVVTSGDLSSSLYCAALFSPQVVVVEGIKTHSETVSTVALRQSGIQVVATAGAVSFEDLVRSPSLKVLFGDLSHVSDSRRFRSPFPVVVEVVRPGCCIVVKDVGKAIECIVRNRAYPVDVRMLGTDGGVLSYPASQK